MENDYRTELAGIKRFDQLVRYLRDHMGWPIEGDDFEELTFEYTPEELGIEAKNAAKIQEIKRLRPLTPNQPWGIFFVKFEPKRLPVVALRRILSQVAIKKRAANNKSERQAWAADDLLFVSNFGEGEQRQISFAHFTTPLERVDLPTLKVLGWDNLDTALHLDEVAHKLSGFLAWPTDVENADAWRKQWRAAFTLYHREAITTAQQLSIRLAELARSIRDRINTALAIESENGPLRKLMNAFQQVLTQDIKGEDFADMYAQTVSYGLLSARIADPRRKTLDDLSSHMRTSPLLRELMETFLKVGGRRGIAGGPGIDFDELGVGDVVELLDNANMNAVVLDFGDKNRDEDPVIHFYEHFLTEYNKKLKIQRGVFYTPQPIVSYIVRSVHELLQTKFNLVDGLADITTWGEMIQENPDMELPAFTNEQGERRPISHTEPFVQILDPATGTATFLVEIIDVIYTTLTHKWKKQHLTEGQRLDAWNEYVPKHLLPRLHAFELMMAPYAIAHMKIGLKLIETGYKFDKEERARIYLTNALERQLRHVPLLGLEALAHEVMAVNEVKSSKFFTVVVGNPPYSIQSQNLNSTARAWVDGYRTVDGIPIVERNALQFEKNIQDDYIKFIRFCEVAINNTGLGIVGLVTSHGFLDGATFRGMRWSLLQTFSKLSILDVHGNSNKKEKSPDGSKDENVFDITQGVAVSLFVKKPESSMPNGVNLRSLWGTRNGSDGKYSWLVHNSFSTSQWENSNPSPPLYLFKKSGNALQNEYEGHIGLAEMMPFFSMGIKTSRDDLVIDFHAEPVMERIERFRSAKLGDKEICEELGITLKKGWNVSKARKALRGVAQLATEVHTFLYRPFDWRKVFYHKAVVFSAAYPVMQHLSNRQNIALVATRQTKDQWDIQCTRNLVGHKSLGAYDANSVFPLFIFDGIVGGQQSFTSVSRVNFSGTFLAALAERLSLPYSAMATEDIFAYMYCVFYSPGYKQRYGEFLKADFPRLPLTNHTQLFLDLARLGNELIGLHLFESPKLKEFGTDYMGARGFVIEKASWSNNTVWLNQQQTTGFSGVPENVWNFRVGGYQVCEKWLKDRQGRKLLKADIEHYQKIIVAISETTELMKDIDDVIEKYGGWPRAFQPNATT